MRVLSETPINDGFFELDLQIARDDFRGLNRAEYILKTIDPETAKAATTLESCKSQSFIGRRFPTRLGPWKRSFYARAILESVTEARQAGSRVGDHRLPPMGSNPKLEHFHCDAKARRSHLR
jgi:hypothetical protein